MRHLTSREPSLEELFLAHYGAGDGGGSGGGRQVRRREVYGERRAERVVAATTARRASFQGALWGLVFGGTIAASASSYAWLFPTAASRAAVALSFQGNTAWAALFGPLRRLDTVAGYTVYKSGMTVIILGAIWGLLIATRVARGEEDAGRWELFLSGRTTRARAAAAGGDRARRPGSRRCGCRRRC